MILIPRESQDVGKAKLPHGNWVRLARLQACTVSGTPLTPLPRATDMWINPAVQGGVGAMGNHLVRGSVQVEVLEKC